MSAEKHKRTLRQVLGDLGAKFSSENRARVAAEELARAVEVDPPTEMWSSVIVYEHGDTKELRVPFNSSEMAAITDATLANERLIEKGGQTSGVERDYWIKGGATFPSSNELGDRKRALRLSRHSAQTADALLRQPYYASVLAFQASQGHPETEMDLRMMRDLPGKFKAHGQPQKRK